MATTTMGPMRLADEHRIDQALGLLACPVCPPGSAELRRDGRTLVCAANHSFDLARQGYVNLWGRAAPANADTAEMVSARERFLSAGHYEPIAAAVAARCRDAGNVVEVGAGTGYYLKRAVTDANPAHHVALDISVAAARSAARTGLAAAVADTWSGLPLLSGQVGALLCIFAPRNAAEFARVLHPDGSVVVVTPAPGHLAALRHRARLLAIEDAKLERLDAGFRSAGLILTERDRLSFDLALTVTSTRDLVAMGPNAFHSSPEMKCRVTQVATDRVEVVVSCFRC